MSLIGTFAVNFPKSRWNSVPARSRTIIMNSWKNYMMRDIHESFRRQMSPERKPWPKRRVISTSFKLLWKSGTLFKSIIGRISGNRLVIGSNLEYAAVHNTGAKFRTTTRQSVWLWANLFGREGSPFRFKKINIPKRSYIGITNRHIQRLKWIVSHVLKGTF